MIREDLTVSVFPPYFHNEIFQKVRGLEYQEHKQ